MKNLCLVRPGRQVTHGLAENKNTLFIADEQAIFFLENIAQKAVFQFVRSEEEPFPLSSEQDLLKFFKLVFASLKESGMMDVKISV